ncbi:unnamed protein product [Spirodela intermedia]|uniref:DYW domain-containing protein n=1 Tax=Spirodela intermedia TaxID=51605 RepID=A0A7I8JLR0_SPIIN|nr:unnamed protein product [Spirodela intermedia]CAA6671098.1 unnamed protein product [Spirodela intermedia]
MVPRPHLNTIAVTIPTARLPIPCTASRCCSPYIHQAAAESQLISAIDASNGLLHARETHARLLRLGFRDSSFLLAKLLRRLAEHGIPMDPYPRLVFSQVRHPNSFLWTSLIRGYSLRGQLQQALLHFASMRRHESCGVAKSLGSGTQLHAQTIFIGGFNSDLYVQNTLIGMYVECGELALAHKVFDKMSVRDVISWTSLIVAYSRSGNMGLAGELFEQAPEKDTVAWTAMVSGFAQNARPRDSLTFFRRMKEEGVETDDVTLVGVISACAQLGAVMEAKKISDDLHRRGSHRGLVVGSALVDMFGKCGLIDEARRVFDAMEEKNVYTYSAMIVGLAAHGQAKDALKLFEEMVTKSSVKPNRVTFVGVLTACSHAGLVEEGHYYFETMWDRHAIVPSADHYACMVDLLGRAGLLEEAHALVNSMPGEPHGGVWGALLGACRIHGNAEIAEVAAESLFKLEPHAIGNYIVLSNVYAQAGMWEKVLKVRGLMRERGLRKNPGCSLMETKDGALHEFFAGDVSHPRTNEIKAALEELLGKLKVAGYVPNLSSVYYDVSDGEKERLLKGHSEKLALAFGILTTGVGQTIRIVKNLRVCDDCHSVMCFASSVAERKIVIRDNLRFHHFQDGVCSCGGFW